MKKRINIMLNEEAIETLNKQPNKSQYIEDLILSGPVAKGNPAEDYIIQTLDKIKQLLEKPRGGGINKEAPVVHKVSIPNLKKRPLSEILAEIKELEAHREERLAYCQDPDEIDRIGSTYKEQIDKLWSEYHESKET